MPRLYYRIEPRGSRLARRSAATIGDLPKGFVFAFDAPHLVFASDTFDSVMQSPEDYVVVEFHGRDAYDPGDIEGVAVKPTSIVRRSSLYDWTARQARGRDSSAREYARDALERLERDMALGMRESAPGAQHTTDLLTLIEVVRARCAIDPTWSFDRRHICEERLLEPVYGLTKYPFWRLVSLPVPSVAHDSAVDEERRTKKYVRQRRSGSPFPPILALPSRKRPGTWWAHDGNHRVAAAKIVGDRFIDAYVPAEESARGRFTGVGRIAGRKLAYVTWSDGRTEEMSLSEFRRRFGVSALTLATGVVVVER